MLVLRYLSWPCPAGPLSSSRLAVIWSHWCVHVEDVLLDGDVASTRIVPSPARTRLASETAWFAASCAITTTHPQADEEDVALVEERMSQASNVYIHGQQCYRPQPPTQFRVRAWMFGILTQRAHTHARAPWVSIHSDLQYTRKKTFAAVIL